VAWFDLAEGVVQADKVFARKSLREALWSLHEAGYEAHIRISAATPEADLEAAVWPGLRKITVSKAESPAALQMIADLVEELEQRRGLRSGTVAMELSIETPLGVQAMYRLAALSPRIAGISLGDGMTLAVHLGARSQQSSALAYAMGECMLASLAGQMPAPADRVYDRLAELEPDRRTEEPIPA